jgi:hypothetical protein
VNGKIVVKSLEKVVEESIGKWNSSLVWNFLDKLLPYFLVN